MRTSFNSAQGGRNVKVLEAMQLVLSIPGAPVVVFLAIDSRVVVASIEESFGVVMQSSNINGWEYLDKIVQLPLSLPECARLTAAHYPNELA